jgi:hypothetical protein
MTKCPYVPPWRSWLIPPREERLALTFIEGGTLLHSHRQQVLNAIMFFYRKVLGKENLPYGIDHPGKSGPHARSSSL